MCYPTSFASGLTAAVEQSCGSKAFATMGLGCPWGLADAYADSGRRELLKRLLALQEETHLQLISPEELLRIQQMWKAARDPDDGRSVARIVNRQRGVTDVLSGPGQSSARVWE